MRLKLGRPDLGQYADRFDVPPATGAWGVTFLGVASLLLDDGETRLMTDGFFSRPPLAKVALGRIAPDLDRIDAVLTRVGVDRLAAVVPVHSTTTTRWTPRWSPTETGAVLVGGESRRTSGGGTACPTTASRS